MKTIRIIPRLDIKGPNLVKGIHLEGLRVLGLPEKFSTSYYQNGADELIYIDSVASLYGRNNLEEIVTKTAKNLFIPLTVGGGIRTVDNMRCLLRAGADKVAINTEAVKNPEILYEGAKVFGSQCIVLSIQAMKVREGKYEVYTDNGREPTGKDVIQWARQGVEMGVGEILITSIDQEGTGNGYDLNLISQVVDAVPVPVIACGGAGKIEHIEELISNCNIDAVCASSIFHYHIVNKLGVEKRDEGNIDYLKRFINSSERILKKINPIAVGELKESLKESGCKAINPQLVHSFTTHRNSRQNTYSFYPKQSSPLIVIVDYGRSNLFSVLRALETVGAKVRISSDPEDIARADKIVLAGVGAFADGMKGLRDKNLIQPLQEFVDGGKPVLGICLGMQLFLSESEEFENHKGLDYIKGKVIHMNDVEDKKDKVKIPHVGWNNIEFPKYDPDGQKWGKSKILNGLFAGDFMYFIHSFMVLPDSSDYIVAETKHGPNVFCSVIKKGNITGCQFHPERSGEAGLKIYRNFINEETELKTAKSYMRQYIRR